MKKIKGKVLKEKDGFKVVFVRHLNHSIQKVWSAISDPAQMKYWFTDVEMNLEEGSPLKIIFRDKDKTVTHGKVLTVNPPNLFRWTWEGELAEWSLEREGDNGCKLTFTYSKLPEDHAVGASAGFQTMVERLEKLLDGSTKMYPFGTEQFNPDQVELREAYETYVFDHYPELEKHSPVIIEQELSASIDEVWKALTNNDELKKWYFDFDGNFKAEKGHEFEWIAGPPDDKKWLHRGVILEVEKNKKLQHSWEFPGYDGYAILTWTLDEHGKQKVKIKLHFEFIEPFDHSQEVLRRKNFVMGWKHIVNELLPGYFS